VALAVDGDDHAEVILVGLREALEGLDVAQDALADPIVLERELQARGGLRSEDVRSELGGERPSSGWRRPRSPAIGGRRRLGV
jgi:hypothetical protein